MIIKSITLGNYRLYEGKNIIKFNQDDEKPIFLISSENGFGKTTFLHSLIWCLYGRLITEVEAEVRKDIANSGYNAFLKNNLNHNVRAKFEALDPAEKDLIKRRGYSSDNEGLKKITTYYVAIEFEDVIIPSLPCTSLKVVRSYDMITEKETVDILIDGKKNELTASIGSEVFINDFILNKDIARFFFFDSSVSRRREKHPPVPGLYSRLQTQTEPSLTRTSMGTSWSSWGSGLPLMRRVRTRPTLRPG